MTLPNDDPAGFPALPPSPPPVVPGRGHRAVVAAITVLAVACVWLGVATWSAGLGEDLGPIALGVVLSVAILLLGAGLYVALGRIQDAERQQARLAAIDLPTGVLNRRGFMNAAAQEFTRAVRYERPLSLLAVDVDDFRAVNDRFGQAAGDVVLAAFAADWRATLRSIDTVGRTGGDEFAVLLPETVPEQARELAQRVCDVCARHRFDFLSPGDAVTVCVGVAHVRTGDSSIEHALARADAALHSAKSAGRNRVLGAEQEVGRH